LVAILFNTVCEACHGPSNPRRIRVEEGLLQGTSEDGLSVYRGVPFAAPPIGDLRWREPQPAAKWDGVRQADKVARRAVAGRQLVDQWKESGLSHQERGLPFLNVWTPARSSNEHIPVMVWIHGGGFTSGSIAVKYDSGEHLAKKGVVVVLNRVPRRAAGLPRHPGLSAENPHHVSGNYGLLDMIAALKWVQTNIAAFGGDPNKVTIFGESAGGIAVSMLCASPQAKGPFHGAISQSGGSFGPTRRTTFPGENMKLLADAERLGEAYAKAAGVSTIAELRKLPPEKTSHGPRRRRYLAHR
jgi:para-nitrobenzyl esterase